MRAFSQLWKITHNLLVLEKTYLRGFGAFTASKILKFDGFFSDVDIVEG